MIEPLVTLANRNTVRNARLLFNAQLNASIQSSNLATCRVDFGKHTHLTVVQQVSSLRPTGIQCTCYGLCEDEMSILIAERLQLVHGALYESKPVSKNMRTESVKNTPESLMDRRNIGGFHTLFHHRGLVWNIFEQ